MARLKSADPEEQIDPQKLVDNLYAATKAYIEGNCGKVWQIGPVQISEHKQSIFFDVVISCVETRPRRTIRKSRA